MPELTKPKKRGPKPRKRIPRVHVGGKRSRVPEHFLRYKAAERAADDLWRFLGQQLSVRCECSPGCYRPANQVHHIFSRDFHPTRWVPENAAFLAQGCHRRIGSDHEENRRLGIRLVGQKRYDQLDLMAHSRCKTDPILAVVTLREEIRYRGLEAQARERGLL